MEPGKGELAVNCRISPKNKLIEMRKKPYMIIKHFRGCGKKFEKKKIDVDAKGSVKFQLKDVNVESDYLRFQVFNRRKWFFPNKRVCIVNILVSELVSSYNAEGNIEINQEGFATYEIVKSSKSRMNGDLEIQYKLSRAVQEGEPKEEPKPKPEPVEAAIVRTYNIIPRFRTPFTSFNWGNYTN